MSKFKVGDRVRIANCRVCETNVKEEACRHMKEDSLLPNRVYEIVAHNSLCEAWVLGGEDANTNWIDGELELVTEGGDMPYQRKTYRLLKDLPDARKGSLWQEACDDGTQPYQLITPEYHKGAVTTTLTYSNRELVEEQPQWFEEVFAVTPEYMTRAELDQWEAFKGRKKTGPKPKVVEATALKPARKRRMRRGEHDRRSQALKASWARRKAQAARS